MAKYLSGLAIKNQVILLTKKGFYGWERIDSELFKYLSGVDKILRYRIKFGRIIDRFIKLFIPLSLRLPDDSFLFPKLWFLALLQISEKPDLLYSRSFPVSSALMALRLKIKYEVPWVMHLSDLWADSPINDFKGSIRQYHQQMEALCFGHADRISFTSQETIEFYANKYPEFSEKFFLSPNVYSEEETQPNPLEFEGKMKLLHAGNFYGPGRSPIHLLKPLQALYTEEPEIASRIEVTFMGNFNDDVSEIFEEYNLPFVQLLGNRSLDESVKQQRSSHLLLLFDWKFENMKSVFFLSKILGYMASQRPILAITGKESTCYNVIEGRYGSCFEHDDFEGVKMFLKNALSAYERKDLNFFRTAKPDPKLGTAYNVRQLQSVFEQLVALKK